MSDWTNTTDIKISEWQIRRILCSLIAAGMDKTNVAGDRYLTPKMVGTKALETLQAIEKALDDESESQPTEG